MEYLFSWNTSKLLSNNIIFIPYPHPHPPKKKTFTNQTWLFQTSKVDPEDHGDTDEDVSDTTPMMQESDSSGLIEQSVNEGRLKALKQRFRYCDYCEVEVISILLLSYDISMI